MDNGSEVRRLLLRIRDHEQAAEGLRVRLRRAVVSHSDTIYIGEGMEMVREPEVTMLAQRTLQALSPSVRHIAELCGVPYRTFRSWRSGTRSPSASSLRTIAKLADDRADVLRGLAVELRRMADSDETGHS